MVLLVVLLLLLVLLLPVAGVGAGPRMPVLLPVPERAWSLHPEFFRLLRFASTACVTAQLPPICSSMLAGVHGIAHACGVRVLSNARYMACAPTLASIGNISPRMRSHKRIVKAAAL